MKHTTTRLYPDVEYKAKEKANGRYLNMIINILVRLWIAGKVDVDEAYRMELKELRNKQTGNLNRKTDLV
jgi:hypothetical protein